MSLNWHAPQQNQAPESSQAEAAARDPEAGWGRGPGGGALRMAAAGGAAGASVKARALAREFIGSWAVAVAAPFRPSAPAAPFPRPPTPGLARTPGAGSMRPTLTPGTGTRP